MQNKFTYSGWYSSDRTMKIATIYNP